MGRYMSTETLLTLCIDVKSKILTFKYFRRAAKNRTFFIILKEPYFRLDGREEMSLGASWESYVGFLKNFALQLFSKHVHGYINLKVKSS